MYYARIALASLAALLATAGLLMLGPQGGGVAIVARAPAGEAVPVGADVRLTFSRPVDRRSAEERFALSPPAPGSFFWQEQTLVFQPSRPLRPETEYTVTIAAGLRDAEGRASAAPLSWRFRTRGPRLLALRAEPDGAATLWLADPAGGEPRQLARVAEGVVDLAVSPDGTRAILVVPRGPQRTALLLLDMADGSARPLVDEGQASAAAPAWDPTGEFLAYERRALSDGALGVPRIWLAQPDGTLLGPLISGSERITFAPTWSPDGGQIAFIDGATQELQIYRFIGDTVVALPAQSGERPSWLPAGDGLVYSSAAIGPQGPELRLGLLTLDGPALRLVGGADAAALSPAVAPDGGRVAFARRPPAAAGGAIWLLDLASGAERPLSSAGDWQETQPAWSPDGALVAFIRLGPGLASAAMVSDPAAGVERAVLADVQLVAWAP